MPGGEDVSVNFWDGGALSDAGGEDVDSVQAVVAHPTLATAAAKILLKHFGKV